MNRIENYFVCFVLSLLVSGVSAFGQNNHQADDISCVLKKTFVTAEDGTKLSTDIYLPVGKGKFPCIIRRTPYNKAGAWKAVKIRKAIEGFIKNGIAFVAQDCRGKYQSEGKFYALRNERKDGLATIKWIRKQPWSNGKIGTSGGSYDGYTQWAVYGAADAMALHLTGANMYEAIYPDKMFSLFLAFSWGFAIDSKTSNSIPSEKLLSSYTTLPLSEADNLVYNKDNPFVTDWLKHPSYDEYWKSLNYGGMNTSPVISIAGWYDLFLMAQIKDFQSLNESGNSDNRLIIGPWCHGIAGFKDNYGGADKIGNIDELIERFMIKHLKGEKVKVMKPPFKDKKYNLFIIGRNEYCGSDVWPPKAVLFTNYYIGSDNCLAPAMFDKQGQLQYTYEPTNPYPAKGGTSLSPYAGPALQNENLSRKDHVTFETDILEKPLILLGPIRANLYVSSDAVSTDFIVCLQDVYPNGNIINIQDGGTTVEFNGIDVKKVDLSVWATGYQLNRGHKLRVVITSSLFPRFNRNINSGEPIFSAKTIKTAHQKIYFGSKYPSAIILPILNLKIVNFTNHFLR